MNIFGKPLSDYVRFSRLFLVLIAVTGLVRLALSLGGVPNSTVKWFSMTGLMWIAVVYYAIRIHKTGFARTNICCRFSPFSTSFSRRLPLPKSHQRDFGPVLN